MSDAPLRQQMQDRREVIYALRKLAKDGKISQAYAREQCDALDAEIVALDAERIAQKEK